MLQSHILARNTSSRRDFLQKAGLGCGSLALTSLLHQEGLLAADSKPSNPLAEKPSQFAPKAKAVIWLFQTGSPSQVDTFDYKPELQKRDGTPLAGADPKTGFFTTSGNCLKSPFKWTQHGESGAWTSEIFPEISKHVDDIAFVYSCYSQSNNHTPAMLEFNSGMIRQGFPSMGSWLTYGLGSENANLPAYVVSARHETARRRPDLVVRLPALRLPGNVTRSSQRHADRQPRPTRRTDRSVSKRSLLNVLNRHVNTRRNALRPRPERRTQVPRLNSSRMTAVPRPSTCRRNRNTFRMPTA